MDLEKVSKSLQTPSMDAQNVTAVLMSFISQIGRQSSKRKNYNDSVVDQESEDDTEELARNLTTILLRSFENNTAFLHTLTKSLNNEEQRWKEEANRRVSDVSSTVLITIYVSLFKNAGPKESLIRRIHKLFNVYAKAFKILIINMNRNRNLE